jgi:hypothetical protein
MATCLSFVLTVSTASVGLASRTTLFRKGEAHLLGTHGESSWILTREVGEEVPLDLIKDDS